MAALASSLQQKLFFACQTKFTPRGAGTRSISSSLFTRSAVRSGRLNLASSFSPSSALLKDSRLGFRSGVVLSHPAADALLFAPRRSSRMASVTRSVTTEIEAPVDAENPLLAESPFPLFDKIEAKHVVPGTRKIIKDLEAELEKLEQSVEPTWQSLVEPLEKLGDRLEVPWGAVGHLKAVKDSEDLRKAVEEVQPERVTFSLRVAQSKPIYEAYKAIREGPVWDTLNEAQRRIVEAELKEAKLSGVALEGEAKERYNAIQQELAQLSTKFSNNIQDATKAFSKLVTDPTQVAGLPPSALGLAAQTAVSKGHEGATPENGPWVFTLDMPSYFPVLQHAKDRALREELYRAYLTRASEGDSDNSPIIERILALKKEKAELIGYPNHAEVSLAMKMATLDKAEQLLEELRSASWDAAVKDLEDLRAFAREDGGEEAADLKHWDMAFWSERLREAKFDISEEELRPYFSLPKVIDGLFSLAKKLFSVEVSAADGVAPVWHPDVRFFQVKHLTGEPLAYFYLDPYSRPAEKRGGAWMDIVLGRSRLLAPPGSSVRLPVAHMVCNQTPPVGDKPSLMTFREVETLFHEFGHALQHMLTKQDEGLVAGIRGVEWDAVELPSQFMENWCYHRGTLMGIAKHYETGESLPEELYQKLVAARTFRAASQMMRQIHFASLDLELHSRFVPGGGETVFEADRRIGKKTQVMPSLPEDRFLCGFSHIFAGGYAAGYYSYKWAEVLSADAFSAFEEVGLDNEEAVKETGQRFRDTVLGLGGGRDPLESSKMAPEVETPVDADNPLLADAPYPLFDKIEAKHVVPGTRKLIRDLEAELEKLEQSVEPTWQSLVEPLEKLGDRLAVPWGAVGHLKAVKDSEDLRKAVEEVQPERVTFSLRVAQSKPIYEAYKAIREGPVWDTLNEAQRRIVEAELKEAKLSGVALEGEAKERYNTIQQELTQLELKFSNNIQDATKALSKLVTDPAQVAGLPPSALGLAAQTAASKGHEGATPENGPWVFTLDMPSYFPVLQHAKDRALREELYRAYLTRASEGDSDNSPIIKRILALKREKAELIGYPNYAEVSLAMKMATLDKAEQLLEELRSASWDAAMQDLEDLRAFAREHGGEEAADLKHWDMAFWSERLREAKYDISQEELRPYFSLPKVIDGLFSLAKKLFSVEVTAADGMAPVWHPDVRFFQVKHLTGEPLAYFYLDPYSRPEQKQGGAWMDSVLGRSRLLAPPGSSVRLPVAHMVCNQTPPVGDKPSLMTFEEVETLFHEFGHALQHMLTKQDEGLVAGIRGVEWDAVELPSQFMENWCYHRGTLMGFAKHYETGESLPEELYQKLVAARTFRAASQMMRQIHYASVDLELHSRFVPGGGETVFEADRRIGKKTQVLPSLPEDRYLCGFSHIFGGGYAAGYYSYKWAEVLSADAFSAFEEVGLDNEEAVKEMGQRFRETVLGLGGGRDPLEVFKDFRGREPSTEPLLRHSGLVAATA
eukprot:jgi/Mesen1/5508/ME000277S04713